MMADRLYNPNHLLDVLLSRMQLKNDTALARMLQVPPPMISEIRHGRLHIGAPLLIRMNGVTAISIDDLRNLMGDRRAHVRIWEPTWTDEQRSMQITPTIGPQGGKSMRVLPELKPGQDWCCGGCGSGIVKNPKKTDFEFSREVFPDGSVISKTQVVYVAPCCDGDLMLWDHNADDYVPWEYADASQRPIAAEA
jgi:plasmid maintenance system antidote protein VapI